jgi:hypothetical protein
MYAAEREECGQLRERVGPIAAATMTMSGESAV